jgi:hypothetical protein
LILIVLIILHYRNRLIFLIFKQKVNINSTLYSTGLIWPLILEILVCLIHTPPYTDNKTFAITTNMTKQVVQLDIDLLISCLVPIRVYLLFKFYSFYSSWADDRAEMICHECNAEGGITFAIKAELKERPYTTVGALMVMSILIFGYILRNVEVAFMKDIHEEKFQDWRFIWNGYWCIIITILTVGYGDYYPQTYLGRTIAVIACLWGTFLISLMVVSLTISVEFTSQEEQAYEEIKKELLYVDLKKKGIHMMKCLNHLKNICSIEGGVYDNPEINRKFRKALREYQKSLKEFRKLRKDILNKEHETSNENILHKLNQILSNDMNDLLTISNNYIVNLLEQIKLSKKFQGDINSLLEKLETMTYGLYDCIKDEEVEKSDKLE